MLSHGNAYGFRRGWHFKITFPEGMMEAEATGAVLGLNAGNVIKSQGNCFP